MDNWNQFVKPYEALLLDINSRLEKSNRTFKAQLGYAPIESIKFRIKSEESARKKLEGKGLALNQQNLLAVTDLAGIRIICRFLDDIPEVVSIIKGWERLKLKNEIDKFTYSQVEILQEQDFITSPKESGYRSYHLDCRENELLFEIQIRTISMDFWASTEHMLKYKYSGGLPADVKEKLKGIAEVGATLDMAMNDIRHDVKIGSVKSRIMEQLYSAIHLLEENNMGYKAEKYRERMERVGDELEALRSLSIEATEDVPRQFWDAQNKHKRNL